MDIHTLKKGCDRFLFYAKNFARYFVPNCLYTPYNTDHLSTEELNIVDKRASYYLRIPRNSRVNVFSATQVKAFKYPFGKKKKFATYFFDLYPFVRTITPEAYFHYIFGDINWEADYPSYVKARPISDGETNNVICKLNQVRHFRFVKDTVPFCEKKSQLLFRNIVRDQPNRTAFIKMFISSPICDVGQINNDDYTDNQEWVKPYMPISDQLGYKFIACIEGHDVATNLKWVMSSNSIAVMPRPRFESWFMEGTLVPDYHYVEIKDDYSDTIEKITYYMQHTDEAERIIGNAHKFVAQFQSKRLENAIQQEVVNRYFALTQ